MGTRTSVTTGDMTEDSAYQRGQPWMRHPQETWPLKQKFKAVTQEEIKGLALCHAVKAEETFIQYERFSSYNKLHRVFAYVALFIDRIKAKCSQADPVPETQGTLLQEHHFNLSEQILVQDAPWNLNIKKYVSLQPGFLVKMDV